jgi:WD40 repeat protein
MDDHSLSSVGPISELLIRWEELRARNEPNSPAELCSGHPELMEELTRRIQALEAMYGVPNQLPQTVIQGEASPSGPLSAMPQVGGYEVLGELGQGGMGVVYKARHLQLNRLVALKMIRAGARARPSDLLRFRIEAEAVAALQHPHIVQLYEVGEADGCPYLSLEYVDGGSLAQRHQEQPCSPLEAAGLIQTLARAADYAHRRGVIHRDLKPANVLLTADCQPKISDFGLAKRLGAERGQTATGNVMGTPSYMAPEQAQGRTREIGPATDVYALGAILYNLLTGRPPFEGDTPLGTLLQVAGHEPVPPSRVRQGIPRDLETICLKCLCKEAAQRYASALDLAEDLQRFQGGESIHARPAGHLERVLKWVKRRPATAALLGVTFLALLALVGMTVSWWKNRELEASYRQVEASYREVEELRSSVRYARDMRLAHQAWYDVQLGHTLRLLDDWQQNDPGRRGWEWHYLDGLCHKDLRTLQGRAGEAFVRPVFSLDGKHLAVTSIYKGEVQVWAVASGQRVASLEGRLHQVSGMSWLPDGRLAVADGTGLVKVWDPTGREETSVFRGNWGGVWTIAFSPDGWRLAASVEPTNRTIQVWDPERGQILHTFQGHTGGVLCVAFSPNGRLLASGGRDRTARIWDMRSGALRVKLAGHALPVHGVAFSPDSTRLATASEDFTVKLWDAATGTLQTTLIGHTGTVGPVAFRPDGRRLASAGNDATVRLWDTTTGKEVRTFRGHTAAVTGIAFSSDGRQLASCDLGGAVKFWDLDSGPQEVRRLSGHANRINQIVFSPNGRQLASASRDRTVRIWAVASDEPVRVLQGHKSEVWSVAFSPDGRRLASCGAEDWDPATGSYRDEAVKLWDTASGKELRTWKEPNTHISAVAFSPDGKWLAGSGLGAWNAAKSDWERVETKLWDAATGDEVRTLANEFVVAFSPDSRWLASTDFKTTLKLLDTRTWQEFRTFQTAPDVGGPVAFSPDSRLMARAKGLESINLWDVTTGKLLHEFRGHWGSANSVSFSPDGRRLASGGADRTVRVWDTQSGLEVLTLKGHTDVVYSVAFSPDGRWLASAGAEAELSGEQPKVSLRPLIRLWDGWPDKTQK